MFVDLQISRPPNLLVYKASGHVLTVEI